MYHFENREREIFSDNQIDNCKYRIYCLKLYAMFLFPFLPSFTKNYNSPDPVSLQLAMVWLSETWSTEKEEEKQEGNNVSREKGPGICSSQERVDWFT
jgi:hypothetical protein